MSPLRPQACAKTRAGADAGPQSETNSCVWSVVVTNGIRVPPALRSRACSVIVSRVAPHVDYLAGNRRVTGELASWPQGETRSPAQTNNARRTQHERD